MSAEEAAADPRLLSVDRARELAGAVSEQLAHGTRDVANESERWFLGVLVGLDRGVQWTFAGVGAVGGGVVRGIDRVRTRFFPRKPIRERLSEAIRREGQRAPIDASSPEFQAFSQNLATLVELVVHGSISVHDVGFAFEPPNPAPPPDRARASDEDPDAPSGAGSEVETEPGTP